MLLFVVRLIASPGYAQVGLQVLQEEAAHGGHDARKDGGARPSLICFVNTV